MIKKSTLINENEKMRKMLFIWENIGIGINATVKEKEIAAKQFLDKHPEYNLYQISETIKINRGTLYNYLYNKVEKPWFVERIEELTKEVKLVFEESNRIYGAGKIVTALQRKGIRTDKKTVLKIMKNNNLVKVTISKPKKPIVNETKRNYFRNLLKQQFNPDAPNKVWTSDFLEINVRGVKWYVCAIMDLFARRIVAWRLSYKLNENLIINTFKDGFENRNEPMDLIFHSDQGVQFKSKRFIEMLKMLGVRQSFSYIGYPNDNACIEGFFSKLRSEEININIDKYENGRVITEYLDKYFKFYNEQRIHFSNNGLTPKEKEDEWYKKHPLN